MAATFKPGDALGPLTGSFDQVAARIGELNERLIERAKGEGGR
jgi:hypothetical protein